MCPVPLLPKTSRVAHRDSDSFAKFGAEAMYMHYKKALSSLPRSSNWTLRVSERSIWTNSSKQSHVLSTPCLVILVYTSLIHDVYISTEIPHIFGQAKQYCLVTRLL